MAEISQGFQCSVVTPESIVLDAQVTSASFPAHDGEYGILRNRAPLVCKLGIGALRLVTSDGPQRWFVDGGFAEVRSNRLTVLTNQALRGDEIDADRARSELDEARAMKVADPASATKRQDAIARAKAQLRLASAG